MQFETTTLADDESLHFRSRILRPGYYKSVMNITQYTLAT
jgi:hypothetical protein